MLGDDDDSNDNDDDPPVVNIRLEEYWYLCKWERVFKHIAVKLNYE